MSDGSTPGSGAPPLGHEHARAFALMGSGVAARLMGTGTGLVLGIAATSIAVRLLGTSKYGVLAYATSTAALLAGVARVGVDSGFPRAVTSTLATDARSRLDHLIRGAATITGATGGLAALVIIVVLAFSPPGVDETTRLVVGACVAAYVVATNVAAVTGGLARGLSRMWAMELPNLTLSFARLAALGVVAILALDELRWVALAYAVAAAITLAACVVLVRRLTPTVQQRFRPDRATGVSMLQLSAPFIVTSLAAVAVSRFDVVVLGLTWSSANVGRYEPTLKLVEQAMLWAPLLFIGPYLPAATRLFTRQDRAAFRDLYFGSSKLVFIVALPAVLILAVFPGQTLRLLYGHAFHARAELVWLLLIGYVVNLALGLNINTLAAAGARRHLIALGLSGLVSMVVLAGTLVPIFGATGAAVATSATDVLVNVISSMMLFSLARLPPMRFDLFVTVSTAVLPVAGLVGLDRLLGRQDYLVLLAEAAAAWVAWLGLLLAVRAVELHEFRRLLPLRGADA